MTERGEFHVTSASSKALEALALQDRVAAALAKDPRTRNVGLSVTVEDGTATVTGAAVSGRVEKAVLTILRHVDGVKEVRCDIELVTLYPTS